MKTVEGLFIKQPLYSEEDKEYSQNTLLATNNSCANTRRKLCKLNREMAFNYDMKPAL